MRSLLLRLLPVAALALAAQAVVPPGVSRGESRAERERYRGPGARALARHSRSVGYPWAGRLERPARLEQSAYLRYVGEYAPRDHFWGTWELVQLLERAAYRVWQRVPGAKLSVGELSAARGGDIPDHGSHENGRDADIAFYMLDGRGRPVEPFAFAEFRGDGSAPAPNEGYRFDDARNWELVAKLVADGDARVQYIFVSAPLRARLLAEGRRRGAPSVVLQRAEQVLVQPARGNPHRDHFHVRIYCPPADRAACRDRAPFHSWYPG